MRFLANFESDHVAVSGSIDALTGHFVHRCMVV
jgi:hypothetical protein